MVFTCDFCNKNISEYSTLYFGFDCICCTNHCRSQVIQLNLQIDPKMTNPHTWFIHKLRTQQEKEKKQEKEKTKEKEKEKEQEQLLPKPTSLTDLLTLLQM